MSGEEAQSHYENAKKRLELLQVLIGPDEIVSTWKKAAKEMKQAGDYLDARELAVQYEEQAKLAEKEEKEKIYRNALGKMQQAGSDSVLYRLARELLKTIPDYPGAQEQIEECSRKIEALEKKERRRETLTGTIILAAVLALLCGVFSHERSEYKKQQETTESFIEQTEEIRI